MKLIARQKYVGAEGVVAKDDVLDVTEQRGAILLQMGLAKYASEPVAKAAPAKKKGR